MRLTLCLLILIFGAAVYAADMQAVGTAEAERIAAEKAVAEEAARAAEAKKAAEAERALKEAAEREAALEAQKAADAEQVAKEEAERALKQAAEQAAIEAQMKAAAEAEQAAREAAAKEAAEKEAAEKEAAAREAAAKEAAAKAAQQPAAPSAAATAIAARSDLGEQCAEPVELSNSEAAQAIADRAKADAAAHAAAPAQLTAAARESVNGLMSAYALDRETAARAYYAALCTELAVAGGSPLSLKPLLALLADMLGLTSSSGTAFAEAPAKAEPVAATPPARTVPAKTEPAPPASDIAGAKPGETHTAGADGGKKAQDASAPAPSSAAPEAALSSTAPKPSEPAAAPKSADSVPPAPADKAAEEPKPQPGKSRLAANAASGLLGETECRALGVSSGCPDLNTMLAELLEKPLEYNHPREMLLGRETEIALVLRTDWEGKDLPQEVAEELKDLPGEVKQGLTRITRVMSAELSGKDFEIARRGGRSAPSRRRSR
ncbi:MAG: hypothetical protein HC850_09665, partial [Rhodomicrobium sp.]|nr:hypothetical protein [Rhodomicrobium sp.]